MKKPTLWRPLLGGVVFIALSIILEWAGLRNSIANPLAFGIALACFIGGPVLTRRVRQIWYTRGTGRCTTSGCQTTTANRCVVCKKHYCSAHAEEVDTFRGQVYLEIQTRAMLPVTSQSLICGSCMNTIMEFCDEEWIATR
jgi:hypothetical protein